MRKSTGFTGKGLKGENNFRERRPRSSLYNFAKNILYLCIDYEN